MGDKTKCPVCKSEVDSATVKRLKMEGRELSDADVELCFAIDELKRELWNIKVRLAATERKADSAHSQTARIGGA